MVLVDTSVWIEVFRKPRAKNRLKSDKGINIEDIVHFDDICTSPSIIQEVLQGFKHERDYRVAKESMLSLPCVESPMTIQTFVEAANLFRTARKQGLTIRSSIDCLIATTAIKYGLTVLHRDRDFDLLAKISSLEVQSVAP